VSEPQPAATASKPHRELRLRKHWLANVAVAAVLLAGLILILLLVMATNNQLLYERYYTQLLWVNVIAAGFLALVILWGIYRLLRRLRKGKFGSRLLIKLAAIFALVGVLPGLFVYTVSYQFVSRSIESWFDVKVEGALESGLNLARTSLETQARDFGNQLRTASAQLANVPEAAAVVPLERMRQQVGAVEASLWSHNGRLIASTGKARFELAPDRPSPRLMRNLRAQGVATQIEGIDDTPAADDEEDQQLGARIRALAVVNDPSIGLLDDQRVVQAVQLLPRELVAHARAVQEANREYQERALGRQGLRRMYIGTLTLSLFLAVFGAVLLAVILGKQLATPLLLIADGVRQVAAGDLRPKLVLPGRDELGGLTRSFAEMTRQLADARAAVNSSMRQVEAARANLQTILDNLTAGVIVLDADGVIRSANPGATRILRVPLAAYVGQPLESVPKLDGFAHDVEGEFKVFEATPDHALDHWQKPLDLYNDTQGANTQAVSLVARGARLPNELHLLVFDDISEVVSAQRTKAWGEVARRLAHEIKNPLTPIQLSAERVEHRLADKLEGSDRALLIKSVRTIVDQVDAMKRLVNEFRDYARLPPAKLVPLDLNNLVAEVLHLYGVTAGEDHGAVATRAAGVRFNRDAACPRILGDAQQLRQVIHNLVQNALDASEPTAAEREAAEDVDRTVLIRTQWLAETEAVRLTVTDRGHGFTDAILKRAFEPYVTTKAKGTGLGLAMVKKIADEHGARVDLSNRLDGARVVGAQVSLTFKPAAHGTTA
jgi:nitrogen fixation/metabolism regulation signal transduction histidine kinase